MRTAEAGPAKTGGSERTGPSVSAKADFEGLVVVVQLAVPSEEDVSLHRLEDGVNNSVQEGEVWRLEAVVSRCTASSAR